MANRTKRPKRKDREAALSEARSILSARGGKPSEPAIAAKLSEAGLSPALAERMAREARLLAATGAIDAPHPPLPPEEARLSPRDLSVLKAMSRGLGGGEFPLLCSMLLCLRARPHPTGRIRYEDRELVECAGHMTAREYRRDFASLHAVGLVSCAVVGSKEPVQTLSLPWAPEAPGEGEETEAVPFAKGAGKALAARLSAETKAKGGS